MIITNLLEHGSMYALTGAFAGFMAGILGIGGGMIVVPALVYIFHQTHVIPNFAEMHVAAGSSLAIMIFTAQASVRAHQRQGEVLWGIYHQVWPGIIVGTIAGAIVADLLPTHWLKILFGIFLLIIGFKMLVNIHVTHPQRFPGTWINRLISFLIGLKSGLLGIGGGALILPYLTYCGVDPKKIPAVSALCTLTVAMIGTITFAITGSDEMGLPAYCTGYIYWPAVIWVAIPSVLFAPIGAQLTYSLPVKQLKYGFTAILFIAGLDMMF
ncbi:permease [Legionella adelaidensis]|uniref:Probable membrane transporter protein n=1 Tax=Legionella adelaidensis TaxID=45056 RepID=A0A0W0R191_9GAMM|nr:sulfite exporter TauE/SafE family protein [Legionella adelaidensis]KTC64834.1 permease [Legionella adelaidensis]